MKANITKIIAGMVRQANSDLDVRLEYQAEALRDTPCREPSVGRWVDDNDVPLLLSALALGDEDFAERYPSMKHIGGEERQRLADTIEGHMEGCRHCSLKRGYDIEAYSRIDRACRENSAALLQLLEEEAVAEAPAIAVEAAAAGLQTHDAEEAAPDDLLSRRGA